MVMDNHDHYRNLIMHVRLGLSTFLNELDFDIDQEKDFKNRCITANTSIFTSSQCKLVVINCREVLLHPRARLDMSNQASNNNYPHDINFKESPYS